MRRRAFFAVFAAALAGLAAILVPSAAGAAPSPTGQAHSAKVCAAPPAGYAACMSLVRVDPAGKPIATATPSGFGPTSI